MTLARLFGRGPDAPIDAANLKAPPYGYSATPAEREREAANIMNYLAGTASGTTADDAMRNYEEIEAARRSSAEVPVVSAPTERPIEAATSSTEMSACALSFLSFILCHVLLYVHTAARSS